MLVSEIKEYINDELKNVQCKMINDVDIIGFSSIANYKSSTITWLKNYHKYCEMQMSLPQIDLLVCDDATANEIKEKNCIICDNPKQVFYNILNHFFPQKKETGRGLYNVISDKARIPDSVVIGNNCVIEEGVVIGENTIIQNNVVLKRRVIIGSDCVIGSNTVIGEEGFGFSKVPNGRYDRVPHYGSVRIGDSVEIGSNVSIDRGTMDDTVIGDGCKIDNLCHIAHNVCMERDVMVIAGSLIAGSVHLSDGAYIAPGTIIKNQVKIGKNTLLGIGTLVLNDVEDERVVYGVPGKQVRDRKKQEEL